MKKYKHIFFDLDHTLWDYNTNARETLSELYEEFDLGGKGAPSFNTFFNHYENHNSFCWSEYRSGKIGMDEVRVTRFIYTLGDFEINKKDIAYQIADLFIERCPDKRNLMPHAEEVLEELSAAYPLHLITNGFHQVQMRKLKRSNLGRFFGEVITSDVAGALKPSEKIFNHALQSVQTKAYEAIYIGDHLEADVLGAQKVGMDQVYFNPKAKPHEVEMTHEVKCLSEIPALFV